jgi:hypothetical protein
MNTQDYRNLQEAYMEVYEQEKARGPRISDFYDLQDNNPAESGGPKGGGTIKGPKRKNVIRKEEVDIYDIILSHLLDEGYAETPEAAEVIMVNMSEEWMQSIVEAYQEPRFNRKNYLAKLSKRGGMGMGTPEDPHGYRDPRMTKVGAEFSKRKTAAARAKKTGQPDSYRAEKEAQSKNC